MKWFDTHEIKHREKLSPEEIEYIKKPSVTIFGPLNIIVRRHWDLLLAVIVLRVIDAAATFDESDSTSTYILAFIWFAAYIWLGYFSIINGRRLAWNRSDWENFEEFKKSETSWAPWGWIILIFIILVSAGGFMEGYLE